MELKLTRFSFPYLSHKGPAKTLVSDFSSITLKKFDLEFSVDPLFRKTCADFDEGGAKGLLLNHLNVYGEGRIIFDASDALTDEYDQYEHEVEPNERIDISKLKCTATVIPF